MAINVIEVRRRLKTLLNDINLVNEYIRQYGPEIDIKNIKTIKEIAEKSVQSSEYGEGKDPIYEIKVTCPVCNKKDITCYEMRAKSQQVQPNKFNVPIYSGAMGHKTVDYIYLAVTICPRCLFASPDKKDFIRPSTSSPIEKKSQITSNVIMTLQERIGERYAQLKYITDYENYFKRKRTYDAAIDSYRLAIKRANVEAYYEQDYCYFKLASYSLKIAKIMKDAGRDNRLMLEEALKWFKEAFRTSNCPSEEIEMQVIYSIVALYLKLGNQRQANSYLAVFASLKTQRTAEMKTTPGLTLATIDKWADKAKNLWEDRDDENLFANE